MTREEQKAIYTKHSVDMVRALVSGHAATVAADKAADDWVKAAVDLQAAVKDVEPEDFLNEEEQYECFVEACQLAHINIDHVALRATRGAFKRETPADVKRALEKYL